MDVVNDDDEKEQKLIDALIDAMEKATDENFLPVDRALYLLLKEYRTKLPYLSDGGERFQKMFRQTDVTGKGKLDMAIWHLIGASEVFWTSLQQIGIEEPT